MSSSTIGTEQINAGERIWEMVLDQIIMLPIAMIFTIPGMVNGFRSVSDISHDQVSPDIFGNMDFLMFIGFALYFCKDSINGQSPAKRILKLQVIDKATKKPSTPIKCFIRNIFTILWPIELVASLINPNRRIGDYVAGTMLVPLDKPVQQEKKDWRQIGISFALAYILMLLITLPFSIINSRTTNFDADYDETTLNEFVSKETEKLFTDSLGNHLTADIRVYDKIKGEEIKYVSLILKLKRN